MIVAIDLGTTNSLIGVWRNGEPRLIPNAIGDLLTPSAVSMLDSGEIVVGRAARDRLVSHPRRSAAAFKRVMGTNRALTLGDRDFRPEEVSALVLRSLKADAEAWLGEPVREAVITVPAYFADAQRKATQAAAELAGLRCERLLNEPTAAALAYGLQEQGESRILVVDLGGGTFDVSVLEMFEGVMEVRATAGDNFLGGEDFNDALLAAFMREVGTPAGLPPPADEPPFHGLLRRQIERLKQQLSQEDTATLSLPWRAGTLTWTVSREQFTALCEPLYKRIRQPIERALRDARIHPGELAAVVLAGGATRMPALRRMISLLFRHMPTQHIDPDQVVAMGATVQAGLMMRDAALNERVLTDVAPFTLGVEVANRQPDGHIVHNLFVPVIERNTVIPASRATTLSTLEDRQTRVSLRVFQGESRRSKDNILLGELTIRVPPGPRGQQSVEVRFTYDTSGLLEVDATVLSTGAHDHLLIEGNPGRLSPGEIKQRLAALAHLKVSPRDQAENVAALARAERLFEELLSEQRSAVGDWIGEFLGALEGGDPRQIGLSRALLLQRLDRVEPMSPFD